MVEYNFEYFRTKEGILKFIQLIVGAVALGMILYYDVCNYCLHFLFTFFIGTFALLLSIIFGAGLDMIYEGIYHLFGFAFLLGGSLELLVSSADKSGFKVHDVLIAASCVGILNSILYLISCIIAFREK